MPRRLVEALEARRLLAIAINEFGGSTISGSPASPAGITTGPDGNLWFTESFVPRSSIDRLTPSGAIQRYVTGLSALSIPTGITSGPDGALWFTEYGNASTGSPFGGASKIGRIDPTTGLITEFPIPTITGGADQITLGPDGDLWFTENKGDKIGRINPTTHAIQEFPIPTANSQPVGIVTGPDHALWFAESNTDQIGRIDPTTDQITEYGQTPGLPTITRNGAPTGITLGPDGNLWFTELKSGTVGKITTQGIVTQYTTGIAATAGPAGITTGPDGDLYFTEQNSGRVARITTQGAVTQFTQGYAPTAGPAGITLGPDGNLWFTELAGTHVDRLTTGGVVTQFPSPDALSPQASPRGITAGPDGALWFVNEGNNSVGRIDIGGIITVFTRGITVGDLFGITDGPDGNLWFTERNGAIGRITTAGVVTEFTRGLNPFVGPNGTTPANPVGITTGPDGNLWFTEESGRVGRITTQGVITEFSAGITPNSFLSGITTGPDGNLWFTENFTSTIGRITPKGVVTQFPLADQSAGPTDIATGPDGALYFTEETAGFIGRITTAGVSTEIPATGGVGPLNEPDGIVLGPDNRLYFVEFNGNLQSGGNSVDRLNANGSFTQIPIPSSGSNPLVVAVGSDRNLWFTESFTNSDTPNSQIGQLVLPQSSVVPSPVAPLFLTQGLPFTSVLATFRDNSTAANAANFAATINFGDGTSGLGTVSPDSNGGFLVAGSHTYASPGVYQGSVTVFNQAGQAVPVPFTANVARSTLSFVVTNTNDSGPGSLRQAIQSANQVGGHLITFAIPGAAGTVRTIALTSALPVIAGPTIIDGTSQGLFDNLSIFTPLVQVDGLGIAARSEGLVFGPKAVNSKLLDLSIFGFQSSQVELDSGSDTVQGDYIGLAAGPTVPPSRASASATSVSDPGSDGLLIRAAFTLVGGQGPGQRNVISGNLGQGIEFQGVAAFGGIVVNNYVGTDPTGTHAVPNRIDGIVVDGGAGGEFIGPGNVISGNGDIGVELNGATGVIISGNFIGTDSSGGKALGNGVTGVCVDVDSSRNTIGGTTGGQANVISGNGQIGLAIQGGSSQNLVASNRIGTDSAGIVAIGNGIAGVFVNESPFNVIGPGNVVSGNGTASQGAGIWVEGAGSTGNSVTGNMVGTDLTGEHALGNSIIGILVNEAALNVIGLGAFGPGNLVSGNTQIGVMLAGLGANHNLVQGNLIGTNLEGTSRLGNGNRSDGAGVYLENAPGNTIGGPQPQLGNLISGNGFDGINGFGPGTSGNKIQGNKIGTDLSGTGPLGNGDDGVVLNGTPGNSVLGNVIAANAVDGIAVSGPGALANILSNNEIGVGVGVGGQRLGNGSFGILIINQAPGTVIGPNLNANNGLGPIRDTNVSPASPSHSASTASKTSAHKKVVKVEHAKVKPTGPRPSLAKAKALHGKSRPKK